MGYQSTHARLRRQPALASTSAPGARDHKRATGPRVYKCPWSPRPQKGNRPSCLQKFLDLEPSRATGPRDHYRTFCLRPQKGNQPSCLQKFLDLEPSRATGTRDYYRTFCPRPQKGNRPLVSTKAGAKLDHQGTTSPTGIQISPFRLRNMNYPSRHALRNQSTTHGNYEGNRPTCPQGSSSSAGG